MLMKWLIDWLINWLFQAQDHCMSPVIVFKYKAAPVSPVESSALDVAGDNGSDADDEQGWGNIVTLKLT